MIKICHFISVMTLTLPTSLSWANSTVNVQSIVDSQIAYEVVFSSDKSDTDQSPGIYSFTRGSKESKPVLLGQILDASRSFNGVLLQFQLNRGASLYDAMTVLDGKLVIFNAKSRPDDSKTRIVLGQNSPLVDAISGTKVPLQAITGTTPNQINVLSLHHDSSGELVLVSVNQPNIMGSGITFALTLKPGSETPVLASPPIIVDYSFLTADALAQLHVGEFKIYSRNHLLNLSQPNGTDDRIVQKYRQEIARFASNMKSAGNARAKSTTGGVTPPSYDVLNRHLVSIEMPTEKIMDRPIPIFQRIDPFGGKSGLIFNSPTNTEKPHIPGRVEFDSKKGRYKIISLSADDMSQDPNGIIILASIDGAHQLLFRPHQANGSTDFRAVSLPTSAPDQFFSAKKVNGLKLTYVDSKNSQLVHHLVLISASYGAGKDTTYALKIQETREFVKVASIIPLQKRFSTISELKNRLVKFEPARGLVLFDNQTTRVSGGPPEKIKDRQETLPLVDLLSSQSNQLVQRYVKPLRSVPIFRQALIWQYFDATGAIESKTGLYLLSPGSEEPDSGSRLFLPGRILLDVNKSEKISKNGSLKLPELIEPYKAEYKIEMGGKDQLKLRAVVTPYLSDEDVKANRVGFRLALLMVGDSSGHLVAPTLTDIYVPFEFSRFQGMRLIQGRRKNIDQLSLLVFADAKEGDTGAASPTRGGAGILNLPIKIQIRPENPQDVIVVHHDPKTAQYIHAGQISPAAVKDRIHFDSEGNALWTMTPEIDRNDRNYAFKHLTQFTEKPVFPNQGFRVSVRWDEGLDDEWSFLIGRTSRWLVDYPNDLNTRFPAVAQYSKAQEKKSPEKGKKRGRERERLFPDLNDYLNQLANPKNNNQHTVLLVDPTLYDTVRNLILSRLLDRVPENDWDLLDDRFHFHAYDPTFDPRETAETLRRIGRVPSKRDVLYVDLNMLMDTEFADRPLSMQNDMVRTAYIGAPIAIPPSKSTSDTQSSSHVKKDGGDQEDEDEIEKDEQSAAPAQTSEQAGLELESETDPADYQRFNYSRLAHLSLEGDSVSLTKVNASNGVRRFTMLVLATPGQWQEMRDAFPKERDAGIFDRFNVDARFLTGPWTVWSPRSAQASAEVLEHHRNPISRDEYQVFQNLERVLLKMVSPETPAKHQLLVVPEEIKPLITRLILNRWANDSKELDSRWSYKNHQLALFQVTPDTNQQTIANSYVGMRGMLGNRRPVLLADMATLLRVGRPTHPEADRAFKVKDPMGRTLNSQFLSGQDDPAEESELSPERSQLPHALWWIAAEGRMIQPKKAKEWKISDDAPTQIPTLIITTPKELEVLEQEASFENRFINFRETFEVTHLDKPSESERVGLLTDLLQRPEIASLHYNFSHENLSAEDARRQLIGLLIGEIEQVSRQQRVESTYAFLRLYTAFKRALSEDIELRRTRNIDALYLFRLLAKIFPRSLTYEIMRRDDPQLKFRDPERAARAMQEYGYEGSGELKVRIVRDWTSHTRGGVDAGRTIPSSIVLIGDKGSGKTYAIDTLAKMEELKEYDFSKPLDDEAGYMKIRVMDIVEEDDPAHPEKLSVAKVTRHISNFLSLPNGWRGAILFDDLHKAGSTKILKDLMAFIQSLFEAPNGLVKVRRLTMDGTPGEAREIPIRNLRIAITLNPTKDKLKRERFIEKWEKKDPVREAIAALHRDDYAIEDSLFSRVSDVIDLSEFPRDAKVPSLLAKLREANQSEFSAHPRIVAVTPRALNALVSTFPHTNARDFLTPATYSLLSLPSASMKAPFFIVDHQIGSERAADVVKSWGGESKIEPGRIEEVLRDSTVVHAIRPGEPKSKLLLLEFLLNNFRGHIYNSLVLGSQNVPELSGSHESRVTLMGPMVGAVVGSLTDFPQIPISSVSIKPYELGVAEHDAVVDLQKEILVRSANVAKPSLSIPTEAGGANQVDLESFMGAGAQSHSERTRIHVLSESSARLRIILETLLAQSLQVKNLADLQKPTEWISNLKETDPKDDFKHASDLVLHEFLRVSRDLYDINLVEIRQRNRVVQMQVYDEMRLFLVALDSAIAQLPWSYVTEFLLNSLNLAANDLALGQKVGLQHFVFKSLRSPMATMMPESIIANAVGLSVMRGVPQETLSRWSAHFNSNCERFLISENTK